MKKEKSAKKVKVKRSPHGGLGLYADESIKKGEFVIEYVGELITNEEADRRLGKYLFEINKTHTIDGRGRNNTARYINHSCRPNCESDVKKGRIYISAIKNITPGDELTYDYGKEYFDEFLKGKCLCLKCQEKKKAASK